MGKLILLDSRIVAYIIISASGMTEMRIADEDYTIIGGCSNSIFLPVITSSTR
jgi:hypothetical protein